MPDKKIKWLVFFAVFFMFPVALCCAQEKLIKLKDGTVMRAKVISKEGELYRFESASMGAVNVKASDVVMIAEPDLANMPKSEADEYQKKIMENPEAMATIQELAQDKQVVEMLSDPALQKAIMNQDVEYLKSNAKFQNFTNNPSIKKIVSDISKNEQGTVSK